MKNLPLSMLTFCANIFGFKLIPKKEKTSKDMDKEFKDIYDICSPYSMTSIDSMYALYKAVEYIVKKKIPGDFVECGVWRGGSAMLIAETLKQLKDTSRKIYLYDTFEGMPRPDKRDVKIRTGISGTDLWEKKQKTGGWYSVGIDEVKKNLLKTGYPEQCFVFVKGKVEDTIPKIIPSSISLLRLDTDWYTSTLHELINLYPILSKDGVLIVDDYGSWSGSRQATDEYFSQNNIVNYFHRVNTGRFLVKN